MNENLRKLKLFIFDVDGVLTDGNLYYSPSGEELKVFFVRDGVGIWILKEKGYKVAFLTGRSSEALRKRAKDLKIDLLMENIKEKHKVIKDIMEKYKCKKEETFFMTDDVIDLKACEMVGFVSTPSDGAEEVKKIANYITKNSGGRGAVREVIELILKAKGEWDFEV